MILNGERKLLLFFLHSLCIAGLENFGELIQQVVVFDLAKLLFAVLVFYDFKDVVLICVCNFALGVAQSGDKCHKVAVIVLEFVDDLKFCNLCGGAEKLWKISPLLLPARIIVS